MCQIRAHAPRPSTRKTLNDLCHFYATRIRLTNQGRGARREHFAGRSVGPPELRERVIH